MNAETKDQIVLQELELSSYLGAKEEERAVPQRLTVTLRLETVAGCRDLQDDLDRTVDYAVLAKAVQAEARRLPRRLLETLAEDLALAALGAFPLEAVQLEVRKYILPDAAFVAVRLRRERADLGGKS